jgi:phosphate transport system substrate-binding protein
LIRNRLLAILIAVGGTVGGTAAVATASASAAGLSGAGSTLVAPLMTNWINGFEIKEGIPVKYAAVGSGEGIKAISNGTVDFGASDAPMTPEQEAKCSGCVTIPWALSATGIGFNIKGFGDKLHLTGPVLAKIYLGQIGKWNSSAIKALNPGEHLPNLKITPIYRSDGSGDTYAFTNYLYDVSSTWRHRVGPYSTSVSFPRGVGAKGNSGVVAALEATNGSIAYAAASYLIAQKQSAAAIENQAGNYEYPNLKNIEAAGSTVSSVPSGNALHIVNPGKHAKKAYPISTFTYVIVHRGASQAGLLKSFINYCLTTGQHFGPALDFAPIPGVVLHAGQSAANSL